MEKFRIILKSLEKVSDEMKKFRMALVRISKEDER